MKITDNKLYGLGITLAQLITILSTFIWNENGRHSINGSVLVFFSSFLWVFGFLGLFELLKKKYPIYSRVGLVYAIYGAMGGVAFAFEGLYSVIFNVSDKIGVEAAELFPLQMNLVLFWAGPAFPLTLLIYGIMLVISKKFKYWVGVLISLGGILFPISRILRISWVAHLDDIILLIPVLFIANVLWNNEEIKS